MYDNKYRPKQNNIHIPYGNDEPVSPMAMEQQQLQNKLAKHQKKPSTMYNAGVNIMQPVVIPKQNNAPQYDVLNTSALNNSSLNNSVLNNSHIPSQPKNNKMQELSEYLKQSQLEFEQKMQSNLHKNHHQQSYQLQHQQPSQQHQQPSKQHVLQDALGKKPEQQMQQIIDKRSQKVDNNYTANLSFPKSTSHLPGQNRPATPQTRLAMEKAKNAMPYYPPNTDIPIASTSSTQSKSYGATYLQGEQHIELNSDIHQPNYEGTQKVLRMAVTGVHEIANHHLRNTLADQAGQKRTSGDQQHMDMFDPQMQKQPGSYYNGIRNLMDQEPSSLHKRYIVEEYHKDVSDRIQDASNNISSRKAEQAQKWIDQRRNSLLDSIPKKPMPPANQHHRSHSNPPVRSRLMLNNQGGQYKGRNNQGGNNQGGKNKNQI